MKKHTLQHALAQFKNAKGLSNRIAATASLLNKTAFQTSKYLFELKHSSTSTSTPSTEHLVELITTAEKSEDQSPIAVSSVEKAPTQQSALFDEYTFRLLELNEQIKELRLKLREAFIEEEKNALYFKILRLERQHQDIVLKRKNLP